MINLKLKLPDGFLDEEVRCDYTVSHEMKELWAVELDLLAEFDRVCKKNSITYTADGGTLLGAVRHHGFIPWDDDIDIAMLRSDYEKLNGIAKEEFKDPYFWQTEETDPGSMRGHAQLRNSNTTGMLKSELDRNIMYNQGVFIDVFPFDNVPDDSVARQQQFDEIVYYRNKAQLEANMTIKYSLKKLLKHNTFKHTMKIMMMHTWNSFAHKNIDYRDDYNMYINKCKQYSNYMTENVADFVFPVDIKKNMRFRNDMVNVENVKF
jgi:lipopolysaccharide cholinephosphotransferase